MINILMVIDSPHQSGSFWRTTGPLNHLRKNSSKDIRCMYRPVEDIRWNDVSAADLILFHRPYHDEHMRIFRMAKAHNVPIWSDYDDHILAVPYDNETHNFYMAPKSQNLTLKMMHQSDVVTVSTHELKRCFDKYRKERDCFIVKNAYMPDLWRHRDVSARANINGKPLHRVMWRGSKHHAKDLMHVKDDFIRVGRQFPEFEFIFVGFNPWYITEELDNSANVSPTDIMSYFDCIYSLRPDIVAVPLFDNIFNRCKSNIAAIEGTYAGGMIVAPEWQEWNMPEVLNYQDFGESLETACNMVLEGTHIQAMEATWSHVIEKFNLDTENVKRDFLIGSLAGDNAQRDFDYMVELLVKQNKEVYGEVDGAAIPLEVGTPALQIATP